MKCAIAAHADIHLIFVHSRRVLTDLDRQANVSVVSPEAKACETSLEVEKIKASRSVCLKGLCRCFCSSSSKD